MSARISFSKLFTYDVEDSSKRLPLSALADESDHIYGLLEFEISGRVLPHMDFFGTDDVCFNTWIEELFRVARTLARSDACEYTFDEGEQGQPAFAFRRRGNLFDVSVVDSELSGAPGDASYQCISCTWPEFQLAVDAFASRFHAALLEQCSLVAEAWWAARAVA